MCKLLLVLFFLVIRVQCFTEQPLSPNEETINHENASLVYLQYGNANLLVHKPIGALENFEKAIVFLDKSENSANILGFLISFGQVIAYDCLHLREECKQAIGSLLLFMNSSNEEKEVDLKKNDNEKTTSFSFREFEKAIEILRDLASIAPSVDIREFLFSLVDEMDEECHSFIELKDSNISEISDWKTYDKPHIPDLENKKSFWKKAKKFLKEFSEWVRLFIQGVNAAKDLKEAYEEMQNQNRQPTNT